MSYKNFKTQVVKHIICSKYPTRESEFEVTISHKPIQRDKCSFVLANTITGEQLSLKAAVGFQGLIYRLEALYSKHLKQIKERKKELDGLRQARIRRYENMMKRINQ